MSGDSSEEKSLPPSDRKLEEERKKGKIAKSQDVVSAALMLFLVTYLVMGWPIIFAAFARMFDTAGIAAAQKGTDLWGPAIRDTWAAMGTIMTPIYVFSFIAIFLGSIISNRGIVIAIEGIKPDLKKIHPVEGFKKIFSVRNLIEFLKALVKSMLLLAALGVAGWFGFEAMMQVPMCEDDCAGEILAIVAFPLVFAAIVLFLVSAGVDVLVQRWLFMRDMRMTHSEMKREMKEIHGDPMVRRARNQLKREIATGTESGKATQYLEQRTPTIVIVSGNQIAVGLRYVAGETPAPVIVFKGTGARAVLLSQHAVNAGIPIASEPELAEILIAKGKIEAFVPESVFRDVANVMNRHM